MPRPCDRIAVRAESSPADRVFWSLRSIPTSSRRTSIQYPTYLELQANRRTRAYVFRLPGLCLERQKPADALREMPAAIRTELAWLEQHGVEVSQKEEQIVVDEVERITLDTDVSRGKWRGLFRYELRPTRGEDLNLVIERTSFARQDLLRVFSGDKSHQEILALFCRHAESELLLLSRLGSHISLDLPEDPREQLEVVRTKAVERLRNLLPGDRERHSVFEGEQWTTRKVLRCFAVSERRLGDQVRAALAAATTDS